uniref:Uncharacterized protein n=1 Tax=Anguilla anguilla TaxID=7936 RepID=A0A0E9P671_ANGAN
MEGGHVAMSNAEVESESTVQKIARLEHATINPVDLCRPYAGYISGGLLWYEFSS